MSNENQSHWTFLYIVKTIHIKTNNIIKYGFGCKNFKIFLSKTVLIIYIIFKQNK